MYVAFLSVFLQEIRLKPISPMAMTSHKPEVGFFFSNPRECFFPQHKRGILFGWVLENWLNAVDLCVPRILRNPVA
jgi:hypothetical protein